LNKLAVVGIKTQGIKFQIPKPKTQIASCKLKNKKNAQCKGQTASMMDWECDS